MPTNLYRPNDNFDIESGHVIPGLMRKAHEARLMRVDANWSSGDPERHNVNSCAVDDGADALVRLMTHCSDEPHVNVGSGSDISIFELAKLIADVVGFTGAVVPDTSKPDGTPRKLLNSSKLLSLGWRPRIGLADGLSRTYAWFVEALADEQKPDGALQRIRGFRIGPSRHGRRLADISWSFIGRSSRNA